MAVYRYCELTEAKAELVYLIPELGMPLFTMTGSHSTHEHTLLRAIEVMVKPKKEILLP